MSSPTSSSVRRRHELDSVALRVVEVHKAAPCATVACAFLRDGTWHVEEGAAGHLWPHGPPAEPCTIFDLASVTKPLIAATLARLVRIGRIALHTPLGELVAEAEGTASAQVTLELLLSHRAGLDGHRRLYAPLESGGTVDLKAALREAACARRPECAGPPPIEGFAPVYSDLGYLLLGQAMSLAAGQPLDDLVAEQLCQPLDLQIASARRWRSRLDTFDKLVAPTEDVAWRGGWVRGAVHDENAWALAGFGVCGHAGLFGTVRDVVLFGAVLLDVVRSCAEPWLRRKELEVLTRPRPGGTLRAGFDGKSEQGSSAGARCSPHAFGHLGFTGTSLWIDPEQLVAVALMSNRVHPSRNNIAIKAARPDVHEALFAWGQEQTRSVATDRHSTLEVVH